MAKSKDKRPAKSDSQQESDKPFIKVDKKAFDPTLASLFASSLGPVQAPPKSRYQERIQKQQGGVSHEEDNDAELSSLSGSDAEDESEEEEQDDTDVDMEDEAAEPESEPEPTDKAADLARLKESALNGTKEKNKKRKRGGQEEIEDTYMRKLAREEEKEEEQRQKKRKTKELAQQADEESQDESATSSESEAEEEELTIPQHESLAQQDGKDASEIEKAARTVFLGNVSTECINSKTAEKALKKHLESFIADLADNKPPHKIESIRFRSTAFASALPKRAAFAKKEIMDSTTKSTNAYAVYSTKVAAREAVKRLNGSVLLNRHLHLDSVAHPTKVDHRRCVFVGNLGFVDDESAMAANDPDKKMRAKPPMDVEEGLWVHFSKAGKVESVRVIRDSKTRVGKGIAYVQYADENGVEAALLYNEQKFPPLLPRKLRVTRAKAPKKNQNKPVPVTHRPKSTGVYNEKLTDEQKTQAGRATRMLGNAAKAGAASFVFEGHRASAGSGKSGLKTNGRKRGKPSNRSTKRAASWQEKGGKSQFKKKDE